LPGAVTATLAVLVAGLLVAGTGMTVLACARDTSPLTTDPPPVAARPAVYA